MFRRLQKMLAALLVVMLLTTAVCPAFAKSIKAKVKTNAHLYTKASTSSASVPIKKGVKLKVTAVKRGWAKVKYGSLTGYMKTKNLTKAKKKVSPSQWKHKVVKMNWYDGGKNVLKKHHYGYIYDIRSKLTIRIKRMGGHNHADVEPATKADTAKLKSLGHGYSWDSRPVILINNGKYVAAAINTMPHGDQTIHNNGFNGQFCLHLTGSKTHGSGKVNEEHKDSIKEAYNWAH